MDDPLDPFEKPPSGQPQDSANSLEQSGEKLPDVVQREEMNSALSEIQEEKDSSAMNRPPFTENVHRERKDGVFSFLANSESTPIGVPGDVAYHDGALRSRSFRHNLSVLLALTLAAFTLTIWILVRVDSPFGAFSTGPQDIVRAQLRALDQGELRSAYEMFSARYRGQVSFDVWHQVIVTHWRMFHAEVLGSGAPSNAGPGVTLEIYLHGADDKDYRARFTLIRTGGRWWIDDVHWAEEPDQRSVSRT